ncbi:MAG: AMP-binding protein [Pseudomonadales bacterium]|nr:AMP-binding protein [Pseudomonadales bacterium]
MSPAYTRAEIVEQDEILLGCREDEITRRLPERLSHGVLRWATETPDAIAVKSAGVRLTYAELESAVREMQRHFEASDVRPGDRVMLVAENGAALVTMVLALSEMDAVAVIINARLSARELDMIEADADPRLVIYTVSDSVNAGEVADSRRAARHRFAVGEIAETPVRASEPEVTGEPPTSQVLAMIYTTGTTGTPKGVMLTHRNLTFIAYVSGRLRGIGAGDEVYCVLPMSHVFGLSAVTCSVLFSGGTAHVVSRFDPRAALEAFQTEGVVGFLGVPTMYTRLLETLPAMPDWRSPSLRFMYSGGAPLDPDLKSRVEAAFGMPLHNGYGLTESGPTICQTRLYAPLSNCSVGFVLPGVQTKILGEDGTPRGRGEVGELWARGPNIMKGYFRKPEATALVLQDGWLNTGDLVFEDESGSINIAGRTKELIIRSGFNVYPPEVEGVLSSHPDVSVAAVVGRMVGSDEEIVAFLQPVPGSSIDIDSLKAFARERLAGYKLPGRFVVMNELPAAPSGKILKHKLELPA